MNNCADSEALRKASDEVLQGIGRNLIVLQRIEKNLKRLLAYAHIAGPISTITQIIKNQEAGTQREMFGKLIGLYICNFLTPRTTDASSEELKEPHVSFSIDLSLNSESASQERKFVENISKDRNVLVHNFVEHYDISSLENCMTASAWLDSQHEQSASFLHRIRSIMYATAEARKEQLHFLASPEFSSLVERDWLEQTPLVIELARISLQTPRSDGWSVFATAGSLLKQRMPEEMAALRVRYGHKTLKSLVLATELFDTAEESTPRGGSRLLYKIKSALGNGQNQNS